MKVFRRSLLAAFAAAALFPAALWAARPRTLVCQKAIDSPHSQWGRHLKHVMHDEKTGEVTWTFQNGATVTHGNEVMPGARVTGEVPKGFPVHALGKLSGKIRLSCKRHGSIVLALVLAAWIAPAQAQRPYPWSIYLDGFTYLHCIYHECLPNAPLRSHLLHWHGIFKLSRYQAHEGGADWIQTEFPSDESAHSIDIYDGGPNVFRNYVPDDQGGQVWDGTWTEFCGPNSNGKLPCRAALNIEISGDAEYQNSFFLQAPFVMIYDGDDDAGGRWHVYDVWLDTDVSIADVHTYSAVLAIDNVIATARYQGEQDTGDNIFTFDDFGTYRQQVYFPMDPMYARQFNDNIENVSPDYRDQTSPLGEVARQFLSTNMLLPDGWNIWDLANLDVATERFAYRDQLGGMHPSDLAPGCTYPYGYVVEVCSLGDALWYPIPNGTTAWSVEGYGSSEVYNPGYVGGQLFDGSDDPY